MTTEAPFLEYLTAEDRSLIRENGELLGFGKDALILEEGARSQNLFIVLGGRVRVERDHKGTRVIVATLEANEMFGEMAFLEGVGASASVLADLDGTVVLRLHAERVQSLLISVPGLAARFYQSVAIVLSRRLRETTASIPAMMIEEIAQARPYPAVHVGRAGASDLPASIVFEVDQFKGMMASVDRAPIGNDGSAAAAESAVHEVCNRIHAALREHVLRDVALADAIGAFVFRETFPFFMASRFIDRMLTKPRGFAGDYATINMIYANEPAGDGRLGPLVDKWALGLKFAQAIRDRRNAVSAYIRSNFGRWDRPGRQMPFANLASGPAHEVIDLLDAEESLRSEVSVRCIDIDPQAIDFAAGRARDHGLQDSIHFLCANVMRLVLGKANIDIPPQFLIYSVGLIDHLQDSTVIAVLDWAHGTLMPGGEIIVGNFLQGNPDKPFLDHIGEWILNHRTGDELRSLFARSKFGGSPVSLDTDQTGVQAFARCLKQ